MKKVTENVRNVLGVLANLPEGAGFAREVLAKGVARLGNLLDENKDLYLGKNMNFIKANVCKILLSQMGTDLFELTEQKEKEILGKVRQDSNIIKWQQRKQEALKAFKDQNLSLRLRYIIINYILLYDIYKYIILK